MFFYKFGEMNLRWEKRKQNNKLKLRKQFKCVIKNILQIAGIPQLFFIMNCYIYHSCLYRLMKVFQEASWMAGFRVNIPNGT